MILSLTDFIALIAVYVYFSAFFPASVILTFTGFLQSQSSHDVDL